jgi:hypothetical protein
MSDLTPIKQAFQVQAEFCRSSGSPFAALVLDVLAERFGREAIFGAYLAPWADANPAALFADAVPLRLTGAFHYLVLSGKDPQLAACYPPAVEAPDPAGLGEALTQAAMTQGDLIAGYMASPPQTNEVARSLALVGGFLTVARESGLPLRCLELGASAGLNMNWDRFHYRFGQDAEWGEDGSEVRLFGAWSGPAPPLGVEVRVAERRACDQNPIDVRDADQALRLQSYVWPGQTVRLERLRAAIAVKLQTGGLPDRADAADWAEAEAHPKPGVATVVYHSSFIHYPPKPVQARVAAAIEAAGAAATPDAPVAWLSKEPRPDNMAGPDEVRLRLWPSGEDRLLGTAHPHAAWVHWLD